MEKPFVGSRNEPRGETGWWLQQWNIKRVRPSMVPTDQKSNEIPAVRKLVNVLDVLDSFTSRPL